MDFGHDANMARDLFHQVVRNVLEREGWTITHDPLELKVGKRDLYIDLGAEMIAAEIDGRRIAVEIKSFLGASLVAEFHTALGQFLNYRSVLKRQQPERRLYLAVPERVATEFFETELVQLAILDHTLDLIAYDAEIEVIRWIPSN